MSDQDRLPIFPSRANQVLMTNRIALAVRGLNLLKRKKDALELTLREQMKEYALYEAQVRRTVADAVFSIAKADFLGTDFKPAKIMSMKRPDVYMLLRYNQIVGLALPKFELFMNKPECCPLTGLSRGGFQVEIIRDKFQDALKIIVNVASLAYSISLLKDQLRSTNTRHNSLEYVILPRFRNTLHYIISEFFEFEREDFYRLKRSQAKQKERKERFNKIVNRFKIKEQEEDAMANKLKLPKVIDSFDPDQFKPQKLKSNQRKGEPMIGIPMDEEMDFKEDDKIAAERRIASKETKLSIIENKALKKEDKKRHKKKQTDKDEPTTSKKTKKQKSSEEEQQEEQQEEQNLDDEDENEEKNQDNAKDEQQ